MATYSLGSILFIANSEGHMVNDPIAALESVAAAGFHETELVAEGEEWKVPGSPHDAGKYRGTLERVGLYPHTIHSPFVEYSLASPDEETRKKGVAVIADAMRFLAELGGRTAIVHPTGRPKPGASSYELETMGTSTDYSYESVSELVRVSEETGVRIALENLAGLNMTCRPLESMQELRAFVAAFPSANVGLCLDVGHSLISGLDPAQQARVASERLYALHLQDGDGQDDRHWVPGRGSVDWPSLAAALSDIEFDGAWTVEVIPVHSTATSEEIARECVALRESWEVGGLASTPSCR